MAAISIWTGGRKSTRPGAVMTPCCGLSWPVSHLADLHVHFEGAIPREALQRIAARHGLPFPSLQCRPQSFDGFFEVFRTRAGLLRTVQDIEFAAEMTAKSFRDTGISYAEVHVSPGLIARSCPAEIPEILQAVHCGFRRVPEIGLYLIVDVVRHHPMDLVDEIVAVSLELREDAGIVALGLGGREDTALVKAHERNFARAAAQGLHVVAHAGEQSGPEDIVACLDVLKVERLGHGLAAARDPQLLRRLAATDIPVEVCLSSNLALGGFPDIRCHPVGAFLNAGVTVILATDDPAIFETSLQEEFSKLGELGLSPHSVREIAANAWRRRFVFDPAEDAAAMN